MPKDNDYMRRYRERRTANSGKPIGRPQKNQFSMPEKVEGTKEERAKIFEQIDKFYEIPNGAMKEYHVEVFGGRIDIYFDNNFLRGEDTYINLPSGKKASEAERNGAIKYAIYRTYNVIIF